jgi:formamidopyrimidine-DNA glycosylase
LPELPEVETMVQKLRKWLPEGSYISYASQCDPRYLKELGDLKSVDGKVRAVYRRGKFIIFDMDRGTLVCHNAMSGFWDVDYDPWTFDYVEGKRTSSEKDVRVELRVKHLGKDFKLRFHDARKFGSLRFSDWEFPMLDKLGPEAIETPCTLPNKLGKWNIIDLGIACDSKRTIKEILMDQENVAGIGNIYANEALWYARVNPWTTGEKLVRDHDLLQKVHGSAVYVLQRALNFDLWYGALSVYRRKECKICGSGIIAEKIKGRGTYRCPRCQK